MKKIILTLGALALLIHGGLGFSDQSLALTNDAKTENSNRALDYIGRKIDTSKRENFKRYWTSFLITPKRNPARPSERLNAILAKLGGVIFITDQEQKILLLVESQTDSSGVEWDVVHDAIDIPSGLELAGWEGEEDCIERNHPQENIFAIGKWKARISKNGGYEGAYMNPIIKGWRVDFSAKKFIATSKNSIMCLNKNSSDAP